MEAKNKCLFVEILAHVKALQVDRITSEALTTACLSPGVASACNALQSFKFYFVDDYLFGTEFLLSMDTELLNANTCLKVPPSHRAPMVILITN